MQRLISTGNTEFEVALKYFALIGITNNLSLTKRELQLLAFTALNRDISSGGKKEEFIKEFDSSLATIGNMIHKLKKLHILKSMGGKTRLNPVFSLDKEIKLYVELKR